MVVAISIIQTSWVFRWKAPRASIEKKKIHPHYFLQAPSRYILKAGRGNWGKNTLDVWRPVQFKDLTRHTTPELGAPEQLRRENITNALLFEISMRRWFQISSLPNTHGNSFRICRLSKDSNEGKIDVFIQDFCSLLRHTHAGLEDSRSGVLHEIPLTRIDLLHDTGVVSLGFTVIHGACIFLKAVE